MPKITPVTGTPAINAAYKGTDITGTQLVAPLDKKSLSDAANLNGVAPAFQTYSAAPKWDAATFNTLPALP